MLYKYTYTWYKGGDFGFLGSEEQWQNYIDETGGVYENVTKEAVTDLRHISEHVKTVLSPDDNPFEKGTTLATQWEIAFHDYHDFVGKQTLQEQAQEHFSH